MKSLLKNVVRTEVGVYYLDRNPLNNRKENLSFTKSFFILHENYAEMVSECKRYKVKVDLGVIGFLRLCNWSYRDNGYVFTRINRENIHLHRFLMGLGKYSKEERIVVDHINGDSTDNRISNLRICKEKSNNINSKKNTGDKITSKYKGLSWSDKQKVWRVRVTMDGKVRYYGEFTDEIAGANAYNYYSKIIHQDFSRINDVKHMEKDEFEKYLR